MAPIKFRNTQKSFNLSKQIVQRTIQGMLNTVNYSDWYNFKVIKVSVCLV